MGKDEINAFELGTVSILNETALIVTRFDWTADGSKLRLGFDQNLALSIDSKKPPLDEITRGQTNVRPPGDSPPGKRAAPGRDG